MASERFVMASERAAKKPRRAIPAAQTQTPAWIALTTHDGHFGPDPLPMAWGDGDPEQRGPVLATTRHPNQRNAIGAHAGSYSIYRGLAVAAMMHHNKKLMIMGSPPKTHSSMGSPQKYLIMGSPQKQT